MELILKLCKESWWSSGKTTHVLCDPNYIFPHTFLLSMTTVKILDDYKKC